MDNAKDGAQLSLSNINDYLVPSQVCIKPLPAKKPDIDSSGMKIEIGEDTGIYYEVDQNGTFKELQTVTINLDDCLACSGCVTSTEAVLVTTQTHKQVVDALNLIKKIVDNKSSDDHDDDLPLIAIATVSPQTIASFSAKYSISPNESFHRIESLLKSMGVMEVFDSSFGRDFSLLECAKDFVERYKRMKQGLVDEKNLPLFTSSCPGWICYAEKVHGELLPYITTSRSPQQILGSFVKDFIPSICSVNRKSIYHFSVMPCYDKKIEASRSDFNVDGLKDVDCVITTAELDTMFKENGMDFENFNEHNLPRITPGSNKISEHLSISGLSYPRRSLLGTEGSSSGGYQSFVMRYAAKELFNIELNPDSIEHGSSQVTVRELSSENCKEYTLVNSNSKEVLFTFYRVYGFKNMQSVIRAVKRLNSANNRLRKTNLIPISSNASKKLRTSTFSQNFHFVEIMACPSGCINGAGQLKDEEKSSTSSFGSQKSIADRAEMAYQSIGENNGYIFPDKSDYILKIYGIWLHASEDERSRIRERLHTQYHTVEKSDFLGIKW